MRKKSELSLGRFFLNYMMSVTLLAVLLTSSITIFRQFWNFERESEELRRNYILSRESLVKSQVLHVIDYIRYMQAQTERRLKDTIRERVGEVTSLAESVYKKRGRGESITSLKERIKTIVRPLRFNDNRGYYFALDMEGVEQIYGASPHLEGRSMLETEGETSTVVRDMIDIVRNRREGFYRYRWSRPGGSQSDLAEKISYVRYFEPFDWFFGTGEYLADVEGKIRREALKRISEMRFGDDGLFFVLDGDGIGLPLFKDRSYPKSLPIHELFSSAGTRGVFRHFSRDEKSRVSFIVRLPDWNWLIGASLGMDGVEKVISSQRNDLRAHVWEQVRQIFLVALVVSLMVFVMAYFLSWRLSSVFDILISFFRKEGFYRHSLKEDDFNIHELRLLARSVNKMSENLRSAQEKSRIFKAFVEASGQGFCMIDLEGKISYLNLTFSKLLGLGPRNTLIGSPYEILYPGYMHSRLKKEILPTVLKEGQWTGEMELLTSDGRLVPAIENFFLIRDSGGSILFYANVVTDIAERKQFEQELERQRNLLGHVISSVPSGIALKDRDSRYRLVNSPILQLWGRNGEEVIGKRDDELFPDMDIDRFRSEDEKVMEEKVAIEFDEFLKLGQREVWLHTVKRPFYGINGDVDGVLLTFNDITTRKKRRVSLSEPVRLQRMQTVLKASS